MRRLDPVDLRPTDPTPDRSTSLVWPGDPAEMLTERNVTRPTLTPFLPEGRATGQAVVVCPGGAHHVLGVRHEGELVARALADRGVAGFVLRYRLLPSAESDEQFLTEIRALLADRPALSRLTEQHRPTEVADGTAALDLVRERAQEWGVDPARLGVLGFSAGAFVALRTALEAPPASRPAHVAAIYGGTWGGPGPGPDAPPLFCAWAADDDIGRAVLDTCEQTEAAWRAAGVPVEAHVYPDGGHGFGLRRLGTGSDAWFEAYLDWLGRLG